MILAKLLSYLCYDINITWKLRYMHLVTQFAHTSQNYFKLLKINDIVIEQEHFKHSQFLAKKIGLCQMHLTVHLGGDDSVFLLINWVIAPIN